MTQSTNEVSEEIRRLSEALEFSASPPTKEDILFKLNDWYETLKDYDCWRCKELQQEVDILTDDLCKAEDRWANRED